MIGRHVFDLLGSGEMMLGTPLPWTRDTIRGYDWGLAPSTSITSGSGRDIKLPWELSRFYHAPHLAYAFFLTREEVYCVELIAQIEDWIEKNPYGRGPNWMSAMEVSIRVANWCLALELVKPYLVESGSRYRDFLMRVTQSLVAHAEYIESHLEYGRANHYLANMVGLSYVGAFLLPLREAKGWLESAVRGLEECMQQQVYNDGVSYEGSIAYHRLSCELFGQGALICRENGKELSSAFFERLWKMFACAHQYMKPDGRAPGVGDGDNGRLHILTQPLHGWDPSDHRHLRVLARLIWPNKEFDAQKSIVFSSARIAILRSQSLYCFIEASPNGQQGNGGHCHNDTLSFEFAVHGKDGIVDSGTGTYTADSAQRNLFRSTRMHATVRIDEHEQNRIPHQNNGLFWMYNDVHPTVVRWESTELSDLFIAEHDGYRRLSDPVIHRRSFELHKDKERLSITDEFLCKKAHSFEWNFPLHPEVQCVEQNASFCILHIGDSYVRFSYDPALFFAVCESTYSPSYGVITPSHSLQLMRKHTREKLFTFDFTLL